MIVVLYGNNKEIIRERLDELLDGRNVEHLEAHEIPVEQFRVIVGMQSLFGEPTTYVCQGFLSDDTLGKIVFERIHEIKSQIDTYIFVEEKVLKKTKGLLEKNNVEHHEYKKQKGKNRDNSGAVVFAVADALGARSKKNIWVTYQRALLDLATPEEIHGALMWQIKTMQLVKRSNSNPGLHPFVYEKSKKYIKNYSIEELNSLSLAMLGVLHESRSKGGDLGTSLERTLLSLDL